MRRPQRRVTPPQNQDRVDKAMVRGGGIGAVVGGTVPLVGHLVGIPDTIAMQAVGAAGGGYAGAKFGEALAHHALRKDQFKKNKKK